MKKYYCNPVNVDYHYQFINDMQSGSIHVSREAADPSFLYFKGKYYIFASMNLSVWVSEDLTKWKSIRLPDNLPLYDYAPDVRIMGDYVYFSASKRGEICNFYRTKDIENGPYEEIQGSFDFWDPNLFIDDDKRVYFYWGCSNTTPIWGVELDPKTMKMIGDRTVLIEGRPKEHGYERVGEDHCKELIEGKELDIAFEEFKDHMGKDAFDKASDEDKAFFKNMLSNKPFIEGAYMNKHNGRYYLQYAATGAEYNVYCDGVYVSDFPLGPFELARNNPYSYQPGGFLPGAGHGSTMEDVFGNFWHASTMRISLNDPMERRVGIWPAGFDKDGDLFCNTSYGDWPRSVDEGIIDPWKDPEWYLLSRGAKMTASSYCTRNGQKVEGDTSNAKVLKWDTISTAGDNAPSRAAEENVQTFWRAASNDNEWLLMDLGKSMDVRAIQVNFADDNIDVKPKGAINASGFGARIIDDDKHVTRWMLEGSENGTDYEILADRSKSIDNLAHELVIVGKDADVTGKDSGEVLGKKLRFIKLTIFEVPFDAPPAISGLRVFGKGDGKAPGEVAFDADRCGDLDMSVTMNSEGAVGYNIKWGYKEDKLYHSYMYYPDNKSDGTVTKQIRALIKGEPVYVQVEAFNENGITKGNIKCV